MNVEDLLSLKKGQILYSNIAKDWKVEVVSGKAVQDSRGRYEVEVKRLYGDGSTFFLSRVSVDLWRIDKDAVEEPRPLVSAPRSAPYTPPPAKACTVSPVAHTRVRRSAVHKPTHVPSEGEGHEHQPAPVKPTVIRRQRPAGDAAARLERLLGKL